MLPKYVKVSIVLSLLQQMHAQDEVTENVFTTYSSDITSMHKHNNQACYGLNPKRLPSLKQDKGNEHRDCCRLCGDIQR